jgi:hypothetical protein
MIARRQQDLIELIKGIAQVIISDWLISDFGILILSRVTRDQCYDFLNIFAEKFSEKNWRFFSKCC